jgi:3-hydroxyisobutyrate dehydrogenase-like beta-hydroxyacid dehydrogenase
MRVGFIGLGNMGGSMAANLLRSGFELVVFNRTRAKAEALAAAAGARRARVAGSPAEVARDADVVCACLADVAASREVFLGPGGLIESARSGQVLIDHSTVDLGTSRACFEAARARGADFLDAPVSGGPEGAAAGTLSIMAGGDAAAFERARPVLEAMGKTVLHMGASGAGTATKLINQLLVGVHSVAACEALLIGERAGVDRERLLRVLSSAWGQSRMLERIAPAVRERRLEPSGAPLRNLLKDLGIIDRLGADLAVPLPTAREAKRIYEALAAAGRSDWDVAAPIAWLEERAGDGGPPGV